MGFVRKSIWNLRENTQKRRIFSLFDQKLTPKTFKFDTKNPKISHKNDKRHKNIENSDLEGFGLKKHSFLFSF